MNKIPLFSFCRAFQSPFTSTYQNIRKSKNMSALNLEINKEEEKSNLILIFLYRLNR